MKVLKFVAVLLVLLLVGCTSSESSPDVPDQSGQNEITTGDDKRMADSNEVNQNNTYVYEEVNLAESTEEGEHWDQRGMKMTIDIETTEILTQPITTREEAADIANKIFKLIQNEGMFKNFELMQIEYDKFQKIWIFGYWENNIYVDGNSFHIAVNGESSELLRMWVE